MVRYLDMRLLMVVLINMVKTPNFEIGGVSWEVMSWNNLFAFVVVLLAFSFISIEVPLTFTFFTTCSFHIRLRLGNRPISAAVSFIASLTSPRPVFWYVYPFVLLLFFLPTARLFHHALRALESFIPIPINQVYDIFISAAVGRVNEPHQQQQDDGPNSETSDLEANINIEAD